MIRESFEKENYFFYKLLTITIESVKTIFVFFGVVLIYNHSVMETVEIFSGSVVLNYLIYLGFLNEQL